MTRLDTPPQNQTETKTATKKPPSLNPQELLLASMMYICHSFNYTDSIFISEPALLALHVPHLLTFTFVFSHLKGALLKNCEG